MAIWYDLNKVLTYNCLFNFIIGARSFGKTYGAKKRAVKNFLEKGQQFVYLRRYQDELAETAESYFNDIIFDEVFPGVIIEYRNGEYYINDELAGYAMALTKAKDYKSISFPNVWLIIFDEFLIEDNGYSRYLKNEVEQFLSFYMSIDRYRGCIVLFLSNSTELINPYFLYFNLQLPYGSDIYRRGEILLHRLKNKEYEDQRKATRYGSIIAGTNYEKYAIENEFVHNTNTFIMKKTEKAQYYYTFIYKGEEFGVWIDYREGKIFVSKNVDPSCKLVYSVTVDDHNPNTLLLSSLARSPYWRKFIENYKAGNVYFENQRIKGICYEVIKLCVS